MLYLILLANLMSVLVLSPVPIGPAKWVMVRGQVVWPESISLPTPQVIDLGRSPDAEYTLQGGPIVQEPLRVHPRTRGLQNVIVWLRPDDAQNRKSTFPPEAIHPNWKKPTAKTHTITIHHCRYDKRILAIRSGDRLEFMNSDPVADNVKFDGGTGQLFNVLLMPMKSFESNPLHADWVPYYFNSSIHNWMTGRVRVFDHPYFAVTDEHGRFELKDVPVGKWRIMYWTETGFHKGRDGVFGFPVEIKDQGQAKQVLPPLDYQSPDLAR